MTDLSTDDLALAGEYVLGTLDAATRSAVAARIDREPSFAAEVTLWETRLDPLNDALAPVAPPAAAWRGLEARLFPEARRLSPWRWIAAAGALSTATLAAVLWFGAPLATVPGPLWVSDMVSEDGTVRLAALYDEARGEMRVSVGGAPASEGRDFELWLIAGEAAPISLGVMPDAGQAAMPIPEELRPLMLNATLAITDEPSGGAPGGVATGPVVALAALRRI
ncbi:anti-sigma factor [Salipiger bermudensis]|uniref:anti-sigma factor n=1 Tax=Salipiger bermudensis TaxID=344736 RepID=UPI001C99C522|nr:anti-sigma factor [Salipiger bermudensis]MBY6003294.1 anti-sigma factor [Salipiger bermudensis]